MPCKAVGKLLEAIARPRHCCPGYHRARRGDQIQLTTRHKLTLDGISRLHIGEKVATAHVIPARAADDGGDLDDARILLIRVEWRRRRRRESRRVGDEDLSGRPG